MKRIGILTFHRSINYGTYLQCYALSQKLQRLYPNYKIEVINYAFPSTILANYRRILSASKRNLKDFFTQMRIIQNFYRARKMIPLSKHRFFSEEYSDLYRYMKERFEIIIVGSDTVFNCKKSFPNAYLLDDDFGCPKLSYAVSIHDLDYKAISKDNIKQWQRMLNDFSFLGVRDEITKDFINSLNIKIQPVHNCDPTFLLKLDKLGVNKEQLRKRIFHKYKLPQDKPIIGIMTSNKEIGQLIRSRFSKRYSIVSLYERNQFSDVFLYDLTPFEWANIFSLFDLTVTQFFHGTLLSLKNLTPTISFSRSEIEDRYIGKTEDLLRRLNLPENFFRLHEIIADQALQEKFYTFAESLMKNPQKRNIEKAIEKEEQAFLPFKIRLDHLMENNKKYENKKLAN